ncbi:MAG: hypothetical protein ACRBB0_00080 [Pelagimonas sp.]
MLGITGETTVPEGITLPQIQQDLPGLRTFSFVDGHCSEIKDQ